MTYKSGLSTGTNKLTDHARKSGVRRIMKEKPKGLVGKALALQAGGPEFESPGSQNAKLGMAQAHL